MSLFKRKKQNLEENGFAGKPKDYFREVIENRKVKAASWLHEKTSSYSPIQKKIALIIFCILFGGLSFYILAGSIHGHDFNNRNLIIDHLHSGTHPPTIHTIPDSLYQKVERVKEWLDSIRQNDPNRFKVILLSKPFLLYNLQLIERIHQSQMK
jgi:hypothetical protein